MQMLTKSIMEGFVPLYDNSPCIDNYNSSDPIGLYNNINVYFIPEYVNNTDDIIIHTLDDGINILQNKDNNKLYVVEIPKCLYYKSNKDKLENDIEERIKNNNLSLEDEALLKLLINGDMMSMDVNTFRHIMSDKNKQQEIVDKRVRLPDEPKLNNIINSIGNNPPPSNNVVFNDIIHTKVEEVTQNDTHVINYSKMEQIEIYDGLILDSIEYVYIDSEEYKSTHKPKMVKRTYSLNRFRYPINSTPIYNMPYTNSNVINMDDGVIKYNVPNQYSKYPIQDIDVLMDSSNDLYNMNTINMSYGNTNQQSLNNQISYLANNTPIYNKPIWPNSNPYNQSYYNPYNRHNVDYNNPFPEYYNGGYYNRYRPFISAQQQEQINQMYFRTSQIRQKLICGIIGRKYNEEEFNKINAPIDNSAYYNEDITEEQFKAEQNWMDVQRFYYYSMNPNRYYKSEEQRTAEWLQAYLTEYHRRYDNHSLCEFFEEDLPRLEHELWVSKYIDKNSSRNLKSIYNTDDYNRLLSIHASNDPYINTILNDSKYDNNTDLEQDMGLVELLHKHRNKQFQNPPMSAFQSYINRPEIQEQRKRFNEELYGQLYKKQEYMAKRKAGVSDAATDEEVILDMQNNL